MNTGILSTKCAVIDGYQFKFAFVKLHTLWNQRHHKRAREIQANMENEKKKEEEQRLLALDKRLSADVDFTFELEDKIRAQHKINEATKKFDQTQTGAPKLEGFANWTMKPAPFR